MPASGAAGLPNEADAIDVASATSTGLTAYIFTCDLRPPGYPKPRSRHGLNQRLHPHKKTARVFTPGVRSLACVWRSVLFFLFDGLVSGSASSFPEPMLSLNP